MDGWFFLVITVSRPTSSCVVVEVVVVIRIGPWQFENKVTGRVKLYSTIFVGTVTCKSYKTADILI